MDVQKELAKMAELLKLVEQPNDKNLKDDRRRIIQANRLQNILEQENKDQIQAIADHLSISIEEVAKMPYSEVKRITEELGLVSSLLVRVPKVQKANTFISPKDKVSNKLFDGVLLPGTQKAEIAMESKKSNKELSAFVSVDFDQLPNLHTSREITAYDREVHDALVSLYVDGENEYITPLMLYRTMTGNPKAKLTAKNTDEIMDSVRKCSMTRILIESEGEAEAYGMDSAKYEGNLIYTKFVTGVKAGKVNEWIYIMEQPVLYRYASSKGQLSRTDINLLNTPVNKNAENLTLQGYLLRRIEAMKSPKYSKSYNILYDTIFKHLNTQASSDGALRKKQTKLRDSIKIILDDWVEKGFIKGYKNNSERNKIKSLTIIIK